MTAYEELPQPWVHQAEGVGMFLQGSGAIWFDPRLGKTRTTLEAMRLLAGLDRVECAVALGSINALEEWRRWMGIIMPGWGVEVARGLSPWSPAASTRMIVLNPDILDVVSRNGKTYTGWLSTLLRWIGNRRCALIMDECHKYATNPRTKEYKAIQQLALVARYVWQLTGTYYERSALDAHHQLRLLGERYPLRWWRDEKFGDRFCDRTRNPHKGRLTTGHRRDGSEYQYRAGGYDYSGIKEGAEVELMAELEGIVLRRRRGDCLDVPLTRMVPRWVDHFDQNVSFRKDEMERLRSELVLLKATRTIEYVEELKERPVVVYGWHRKLLTHLATHFRAPLIYGDTTQANRVRIGEEFRAGRHPVLVATLGMDAVDLARADHCVYAEVDWSATKMRQSMDRIVNGAKPRETVAHVLLVSGSVEEQIWDRILMKGEAIERLDLAARRLKELGLDMAELSL